MSLLILALLNLGFGIEDRSLVVVDEASPGIVYINADGDDGADAKPALYYGATPESGSSGSSGGSVTIVVRHLPTKVIISARGGNGGNGIDGARGKKGASGENGRSAGWFRKPKEGDDGEDGGPGGNGSHGGHGGKGGHVRLIVAIPENKLPANWQSRFWIDVSGGRGGEAGLGGEGGPGGRGGLGGKKFWSSRRLSSGRDGEAGRIGRAGKPGMEGDSGLIEYFEVDELPEWIVQDLVDDLIEKEPS